MAIELPTKITIALPSVTLPLQLPNALSGSLPNALSGSLPNALSGSLPNALSGSLPNALSGSLPNLPCGPHLPSLPNLSNLLSSLKAVRSLPSLPSLPSLSNVLSGSLPNVLSVSLPNVLSVSLPNVLSVSVSMPNLPSVSSALNLPCLPISITMISCVSNPLMIGLNIVKDALSDNLAGLASGGKESLAALKKIGEDIKDKLKVMIILQLPVLPNFKSEYAMLLASVNDEVAFLKNALDLEKKWGKALGIAVIRGLLDNIGSIDLCKGIPNIDGKLQPDGTVIAIPKAQLSPIPAAPPAAHVPLTPTIENAVTAPTSGNSGVTKDEYNKYLRKTNSILDGVEDPIIKKANDQARAIMALNKTALHVNLVKKFKAANVSSPEEYEKIREFTPAEIDFFEKRSKHFQLNLGLRLMIQVIKTTWYQHELYIASEISKEEYDTWYNECITDIKENLVGDVVELASMAMNAIASLIKQLDANKDIIIKGHQYENNTK